MRLSFITLILSCLSLTLSVFSKPQFLSRRDRNRSLSDVLSWRQYRFPRDIIDICINTDVDLLANAGQLLSLEPILGALGISTEIHLCLCLKDLDLYLQTDNDIKALVGLLGPDAVEALIKGIINTSPDAQKCIFPRHAHRTCNNQDPCHWACDDHYVRDDDTCVCAPPYVSCNGDCGLFPLGCSSAFPRSLKTRAQPILAHSQAQATCKSHESVCGIDGGVGSLAFECIDTASTKDSCGGCMVQHPFREIEPIHHAYGQDCTRISNALFVSCAKSRCIVHSCKVGWVPDASRSECIMDASISSGIRRTSKRSNLLPANVTATAVINSDVLTQLITIVDIVLNLDAYTPGLPASSTLPSTTTYVVSLFNDINAATAGLIGSPTVGALLRHIDRLLDTNSLLKSLLATCGCVDGLGLSDVVQELDVLVAALASLRTWCSDHTGPGTTTTAPSRSAPAASEQPIVISLSSLLAGLGLKGKSINAITALLNGTVIDSTNDLLDALGLGTDRSRGVPAPSTNNSELLAKLAVLVQLVVKLREDSASLTTVSSQHGSSISGDLLTPLVEATANLLNSTTVSSLAVALKEVIGFSVASLQALDLCACVDELGLKQLYQDLKSVLDVASDAHSLCLDQLITGRKPVGAASSGDTPIVVGLSDLLVHPTPGLLGPIQSTTTIDGLGPSLSDAVNSLLGGLGIGPHHAKRTFAAYTSTLDSDILSQVEGLVKLVINLQGFMILMPSSKSDSCFSSLNTGQLMKDMANALICITPLSTTSAVFTTVDHVLGASASLQKALQECKNMAWVDDLSYLLVLIREAAVKLGSTCDSSTRTVVPLSTTTSNLVTHPSDPRTLSVSFGAPTLGKPATLPGTATWTSPVSLPSSMAPSSADDEIILALNQLLASLGLGVGGVVTVGGLGHGLSEPVNNLLDSVGIGPNGLRRREKRQIGIPPDSNTNATVDSTVTLQTHVYALIDLVLELVDACGSSDCSHLGTLPVNFVSKIVNATAETLTSKSWVKFVGGVNHLATASSDAVKLLEGCGCRTGGKLEEAYGYIWRILDVALALQVLCQKMGIGKAGHPIVVGLTRLLDGLERVQLRR